MVMYALCMSFQDVLLSLPFSLLIVLESLLFVEINGNAFSELNAS